MHVRVFPCTPAAAAPIESMIILSMGAAAAGVKGNTLTCIRIKDQGPYILASYIQTSGSRIKDQRYMHHAYMYQGSGSGPDG